jgi:uncharacterized membrane protein YozB (DUF420 family)
MTAIVQESGTVMELRDIDKPSWKVLMSLLLLSLVPAAAGVVRLSELGGGSAATPENARFIATRWPVALHVAGAIVFCMLGAFQFDSAIRQRFPRLHRIAGRVVAPAGVLAALTGLWMTHRYPIPAELQGELLSVVRTVVALAMTVAIVLAVRAVLQRQIDQHKAWMIRAYALGQGAGTQVLLMLPLTLAFGAPTFFVRDVLMASAWILNIVLAEWIIRRRVPFAKVHQPVNSGRLTQAPAAAK